MSDMILKRFRAKNFIVEFFNKELWEVCNIIHKMHHPNRIKRAFCSILLCCVHGLCLGFVVWQTIKCTTKYLRKTQVTIVSLKDSVELPFPALTICGTFGKDYDNHEMRFNATYLQNVCDLRCINILKIFL